MRDDLYSSQLKLTAVPYSWSALSAAPRNRWLQPTAEDLLAALGRG